MLSVAPHGKGEYADYTRMLCRVSNNWEQWSIGEGTGDTSRKGPLTAAFQVIEQQTEWSFMATAEYEWQKALAGDST